MFCSTARNTPVEKYRHMCTHTHRYVERPHTSDEHKLTAMCSGQATKKEEIRRSLKEKGTNKPRCM